MNEWMNELRKEWGKGQWRNEGLKEWRNEGNQLKYFSPHPSSWRERENGMQIEGKCGTFILDISNNPYTLVTKMRNENVQNRYGNITFVCLSAVCRSGWKMKLHFGAQFDEIETSVIYWLGTGMDSSRFIILHVVLTYHVHHNCTTLKCNCWQQITITVFQQADFYFQSSITF